MATSTPEARPAPTLPTVRCLAGSGPRSSHEWAPRPAGAFYCTACLSELDQARVDDWKRLLEVDAQRGGLQLSGEAYTESAELMSNAVLLSPGERRLFHRLAAEPTFVVHHEDLAAALWGQASADPHDRAALRQQVTTLRRKLARLRIGVGAVPSIGYRLSAADTDPPS